MSDEFNEDILDQLAADLQDNPPSMGSSGGKLTPSPTVDMDDIESVEKYVNESAQKSNDILMQVLQNFAADVHDDPERASAFAQLIKSNTELLKLFNDRINKSKDNQTKILVQQMKGQVTSVKETLEREASIVGNRDNIFKEILNDAQEAGEFEEVEVEEVEA